MAGNILTENKSNSIFGNTGEQEKHRHFGVKRYISCSHNL
jgi:hypothetical protein